jgi:hypothetical protein
MSPFRWILVIMPNPPVPQELLRRRGTWRRDRHAPKANVLLLPPAEGPPEPPRPLGPEGRRLWARVWDAGRGWVSPGSDLDMVLMLAETLDERVALRLRLLKAGDAADWRERVALRALDEQITQLLSLLGFSPTSRSRLGVSEIKRASALEELLRERDRLDDDGGA